MEILVPVIYLYFTKACSGFKQNACSKKNLKNKHKLFKNACCLSEDPFLVIKNTLISFYLKYPAVILLLRSSTSFEV